jgi:hypothetical protein
VGNWGSEPREVQPTHQAPNIAEWNLFITRCQVITLRIPDLDSPATYSLTIEETDAHEIANLPFYRRKRIQIPSNGGVASMVDGKILIQWPKPVRGFHSVTVTPEDFREILILELAD